MNPRLQAYLLQCADHDETTVDQALLKASDADVTINNLRQQLAAVTEERDTLKNELQQLRGMIGFVAPTAPDAVKRLEILARTNEDLAFWQLTSIHITGAFEDVVSERDRYRMALETARELLSKHAIGCQQIGVVLSAAVRPIREALEGGE